MGKDKKSSEKNFYAVSRGKSCGIFRQWSQVKPLVDKFPGVAYKGFSTLQEAIAFMCNGDFHINEIMFYEDSTNLDNNEKVSEYAARHGADLSSVEDLRKKNEEGDASESETDEKFLDAVNEINVYVDGCCLNNGNSVGSSKAGLGVFWGLNHKLNVSESIIHGKKTNNTAELLSAIRVLEQIKENSLKNVVVNSDSRYVVDGITKWIYKWKSNNWVTTTGSEVENKALWSNLDALNDEVKPKWQHIGREYNMNADKLAKQGAEVRKLPKTAWK
ncbi:hypothetical protein FSP39_013988 [Pinctada imbricata]|uniref:Ribonuclease H1 n=1 Tax=Pinctada imbricata TaxID=66713 RepID=A0AA89BUN9_PINIB|nr:hypothetical protein FSP39_013988 [Pinctada imbricata]